jgi:hypothetical protein
VGFCTAGCKESVFRCCRWLSQSFRTGTRSCSRNAPRVGWSRAAHRAPPVLSGVATNTIINLLSINLNYRSSVSNNIRLIHSIGSFFINVLSRLQPEPYSWSRDSQHTFGRSYTSTFGRSYTGTLEGTILAHSEGTTGTLGRSYPPSDFRLSIKPGISLSQNSSSS